MTNRALNRNIKTKSKKQITPNTLLPFYFLFKSDWSEEAVSSAEILRMIYQGRFLHGNVTLAGTNAVDFVQFYNSLFGLCQLISAI
jgi:hypothetical protein